MAWGSVSAVLVRRVLAGAIARGADPVALTDAIGLDQQLLRDVDARVPHTTLLALWQHAERLTGDESFGAHLAEMVASSPNNVMGYAVHSSPTLGAALKRISRYVRLAHESLELSLVEEGERARLELRQRHPFGAHRHGPEFAMVAFCLFARRNLEGGFLPLRVWFSHPSLGGAAARELERLFGVPVAFAQQGDGVEFDRRALDCGLIAPDPQLCSQLDRLMEEMIARQLSGSGLDERTRGAISEQLRNGAPTVEEVAARLRLSPRTLQRRLREGGNSFQALVLEVRRDLALRYLKEADLSVAEVAFHVGFSDVAAFHHAFKRWTGRTPIQVRRAR